jgi:hypothetical protein
LKVSLAAAAATPSSNPDADTTKLKVPLAAAAATPKAPSRHQDTRKWLAGEPRDPFDHKEDIKKFGTIEDVKADGNCGFYAILLGLEKMGKIEPRSMTVTEFRKDLWEYAKTNEKQIRDEAIPESQKKSVKNAISWMTDVLDPLFRVTRRSYETGCHRCDWICGHWHFPLIAHKFQIAIVVYSSEKRTTITKPTKSDWLPRLLAHPRSLARAPWSVDIASAIFLVHANGCHYLHLSVPSDIQEPPEEDQSMKEPEQRDGSNPIDLDSVTI